MIIDTHTHFYDPTRPQGIPWPREGDDPLYRRVLPEHFRALAEPHGVTGTIVVEASSWLEDNQWVLDMAADEPFIVGLVGHIDLDSDEFLQHLERFSHNPLFLGIRLSGQALTALDASGVARLEALAAGDKVLDLLLDPSHLTHVTDLARRIPNLRIVINHIAMIKITTAGQMPDEAGQRDLRDVAACDNVFLKFSGLVEAYGRLGAPADIEFYRPALDFLWDLFGEDRLVYGSNWPVSDLFAHIDTVHELAAEYLHGKGTRAVRKVYGSNSKRVYKWPDR